MSPRALVVGEALVDVTRTPDGAVAEHPGGSPLNVAVTMARQGIDTTLAAQVGNDHFGALIRDHLDRSGVTLLDVGPSGSTASATAMIDAGGAATYEFDLHWEPEHLPDPADFDLVHVGSIGAWMEPGANAVADLVRRAHAQGQAVGFDPNIRPTLGPPVPVLRQRVFDLAASSRFVKLSDEDASVLADGSGDPESVLGSLATAGPALAAMTRGGESVVLCSGDHEVEVPVPAVSVADTIGAGDTWMGTLLAELVRQGWVDRTEFSADELCELGEAAVRASAITVSRPGADPPWRRELL
ncbi:carbohydrate kinase [Aeromicrobium sp. 636]|uniref:Carbohydrate kinase n=1 Tax=Aeromicrobium senzhongii TaxID=2663859 RepID=A0A8I0EUR6_9ACTN|nr:MULTISPECIES: carbohydrate kinase [Aeromicrobium]MBC9225716.1 carbohydrate kinase [Aeromicrobium senzhongii]MCQ3997826.1 carbohydrate kinase [Aeromicrobium sp. 636]